MPWIRPERALPKGPRGGEQQSKQRIGCDKCSWEMKKEYVGYKDSRAEAGVWWPKAEEHQGEGEPGWCPRCASRESERARQSYRSTSLNVEAVMSKCWRAPTGREWERGAVGPVAKEHPGRVPPKAPPPGTSSQAHPGRVPPKAPPPGISSLATEERLAALEEEVAKLRLRVAELEEHSSGAATG